MGNAEYMGSVARNTGPRSRVIHTKIRSAKMNSAFTTTSFTTKSSSIEYSSSRSKRATSEGCDEFYQAMNTDMGRLAREFYTPEPISQTGNYYPRYKVTGNMETGSCHVSYLARPYYFYQKVEDARNEATLVAEKANEAAEKAD